MPKEYIEESKISLQSDIYTDAGFVAQESKVSLQSGVDEAGSLWQIRLEMADHSMDYLIDIEDGPDYPSEINARVISKDQYTAVEGTEWVRVNWNKKKFSLHFADVGTDCMATVGSFALNNKAFAIYAGTYATSYGNLSGTFLFSNKRWAPREQSKDLCSFDFFVREQ